jgi:hypothetical protein
MPIDGHSRMTDQSRWTNCGLRALKVLLVVAIVTNVSVSAALAQAPTFVGNHSEIAAIRRALPTEVCPEANPSYIFQTGRYAITEGSCGNPEMHAALVKSGSRWRRSPRCHFGGGVVPNDILRRNLIACGFPTTVADKLVNLRGHNSDETNSPSTGAQQPVTVGRLANVVNGVVLVASRFLGARYATVTEASAARYEVLYGYTEGCDGGNACAAGFISGQRGSDAGTGRPVLLSDGIPARWTEASCSGAHCDNAKLAFVRNGMLYTIGVKGGRLSDALDVASHLVAIHGTSRK